MDLQEIVRKEVHKILLEAKSPDQKEIQQHALAMARKYKVPFDIIMRHMWVESRYKVRARGGHGEVGLMQLLPNTADGLGVDPYDWRQNIEGGTKYLHNIFRRMDRRTNRIRGAQAAGVKGIKDKWQAVAAAYNRGEGAFNKIVRRAIDAGYVGEDGKVDWKKYINDGAPVDGQTTDYYKSAIRYAAKIHDPNNGVQKSRFKRKGYGYLIDVPEEQISETGRSNFSDDFKVKTKATREEAGKKTIVYIGDSTTGGMKPYLERAAREAGQNIKVFYVNGAGAAVMHTMVTGEKNRVSKALARMRGKDKASEIAKEIAKLKQQGPVSIRIATLGGNDARSFGSQSGQFRRYASKYVRPLFKLVDEVGGSGRGKSRRGDLRNKFINDAYKKIAAEMGVPYYQARGEEGKPQTFGSPWEPSDDYPFRKKQSKTIYYRRQAEERFKFTQSSLTTPAPTPKEVPSADPPAASVDPLTPDTPTIEPTVAGMRVSEIPEYWRNYVSVFADKATAPSPPQAPSPAATAAAAVNQKASNISHQHGDHASVIHIPPTTDLSKPVTVITYFHGYGTPPEDLKKIISARAYDQNVVVAAPVFQQHKRDGGEEGSRLALRSGYMSSVASAIKSEMGQTISISKVQGIAHSAGGKSMGDWVRSEADLPYEKFKLLDASYDGPDRFQDLVGKVGEENIQVVVDHPDSKTGRMSLKYKKRFPGITQTVARGMSHRDIGAKWEWEAHDHDHDHDHDHGDHEPLDMSRFKRGHKGAMMAAFRGAKGVHIKNTRRTHGTPAMHNYLRSLSGFGGRQWYVEDISNPGGGKMTYHKSHRRGEDVDIAIPTLSKNPYDGSRMGIYQRRGRTKWNFTRVKPDNLDVDATMDFIRHTAKGARKIYLDDSLIKVLRKNGEGLVHTGQMEQQEFDKIFGRYGHQWRAILRHEPGHANHFHVRLKRNLDPGTYTPPKLPDPVPEQPKIEPPNPVAVKPVVPKVPDTPPQAPTIAGQPVSEIPEEWRGPLSAFLDEPEPPKPPVAPAPTVSAVTPPVPLEKVVESHLRNYFGL